MLMTQAELAARKRRWQEIVFLEPEPEEEDNCLFAIIPTASADPELLWAAQNGGPVCPTYQWHRVGFFDDPDLDAA